MEPFYIFLLIFITACFLALIIQAVGLLNEIKKLKIEILDLKKKLSESEKKLADNMVEIRWLKWQLENPPKYKKGDKFGNMMIISVEFKKPSWIPLIVEVFKKMFFPFMKHNPYASSDKSQYAHAPSWEYKLVNSVTHDEFTKTQSEVDEFAAEVKKD